VVEHFAYVAFPGAKLGPSRDAIRVGLGSVWLSILEDGNVWGIDPHLIEGMRHD
jgi:hypothetical protein